MPWVAEPRLPGDGAHVTSHAAVPCRHSRQHWDATHRNRRASRAVRFCAGASVHACTLVGGVGLLSETQAHVWKKKQAVTPQRLVESNGTVVWPEPVWYAPRRIRMMIGVCVMLCAVCCVSRRHRVVTSGFCVALLSTVCVVTNVCGPVYLWALCLALCGASLRRARHLVPRLVHSCRCRRSCDSRASTAVRGTICMQREASDWEEI